MTRWKSLGDRKRKMSKAAAIFISTKIEQLINEGYEPQQAKAIAYAEARKRYKSVKGRKRDVMNLPAHPQSSGQSHEHWLYYGGKERGEPEPNEF